MSLVTTQRTPRRRRLGAATVAGAVVAACVSVVLPTAAHGASVFGSTFTGYSIAGVASQSVRVPADLAKQVIVLTGTGFSEDNIESIDLGPACLAVVTYVVQSATTISVKTPSSLSGDGCAATTGSALTGGDSVVINEVGNSAALTKAGLYFVNPPEVAAVNPVITETSSNLLPADQVKTLLPGGSQLIRVTAASDFAFDGKLTSTNALTASLGGKALTSITVYLSTGVAQGTGGTADNGNWFTAVTPILVAGGSYPLVVSQGGVARSFSTAVTGLTWPAVPTVTSVATSVGIAGKSGSTLKITGTNFSTVASDVTVTICGAAATITTPASNATTIYVTAPVVAKTALPSGLGAAVLDGPCAVRVTNVTANLTSPITSGAYYVYVINRNP